MMTFTQRQPIVVADTGPLIRLAAAGLLDTLRVLNRRVVLVDRIEEEAFGDLSKPFANEIRLWVEKMGPAVQHEQTLVGIAINTLRNSPFSLESSQLLKKSMRNSGERAIREFIELHAPDSVDDALVLYEDSDVRNLLGAATVPLTAVTTRRFVQLLVDWGINTDAVTALEDIADEFDLRPAHSFIVTPSTSSVK